MLFPIVENATIADPTDPEVAEAMALHDAWERSLAALYAALPVPRPSFSLRVVLVPGSTRRHKVATVGEVVRMVTATRAHVEGRWCAVRTVCGRRGPFENEAWPRRYRQTCQKCNDLLDTAWEGHGEAEVSGLALVPGLEAAV